MFIARPTPDEILSAITGVGIKEGEVAVIMLGEKNTPDMEQLIGLLNQHGITFVGAVFPGVITDNQRSEEGAVVMILPALASPFLIKTTSEAIDLSHLKEIMADQPRKYTAMIFVDALSSNVAAVLSELFNQLGSSVSYVGGGAGSLSLKQAPCIFTPEGYVQDVVAVTFIRLESSVNARHGWQKVMGPIVATRTHKNLIAELNWRNAFEVYRTIVEKDSGATLTRENFFDLAKGYPFGLYKEGVEDIVRDPVGFTDAGELVFVIDIPENAAFNLLRGNSEAVIRAAGEAAASCQVPAGRKAAHNIVVDCISRVLYLEQDFSQELEQVKAHIPASGGQLATEGILSLGEIAPDEEGVLQLYNKTIVVGMFYE